MSPDFIRRRLAQHMGRPWETLAPGVQAMLEAYDPRRLAESPEIVAFLKRFQVTPEDASFFVGHFAKGAQYVHDRFGTDSVIPRLSDRLGTTRKACLSSKPSSPARTARNATGCSSIPGISGGGGRRWRDYHGQQQRAWDGFSGI